MIYTTTRLEELRAIKAKVEALIVRVETGRDLPLRPRFEEDKLKDAVCISEWEYHIERVYKE